MPLTAEPEMQTRAAASTGGSEDDWLCVWCHNHVSSECDRFSFEGKSEFAFTNPEGIHFVVLTFSETCACRETGQPTLEHTWFPGHAWSYCQCGQCGQHLGWFYAGPHKFAGLIKPRLVRAAYLRN